MQLKVIDKAGKVVSEKKLNVPQAMKAELSHVMALLIKLEQNNARQASANTKTRSEVRGGGAKPYKQKGTGRARRGTNRTPLRRGGAIVFGPKPRIITRKQNTQFINKGFYGILKAKQDAVVVLDKSCEDILKSKEFIKMTGLKSTESLLLITTSDEAVGRAAGNLVNVEICTPQKVWVQGLINRDRIVFTQNALETFERIRSHA